MLETVDLKARLAKEEYKTAMDRLDLELGGLQRRLREANLPLLVVFEGWDAAGKGSVMSRLLQALDPRGYKVYNIAPSTERETFFPPMRRFWLTLPNDGAIAIYNHSWYRQVLNERVEENDTAGQWQTAYERIRVFERQLGDDGAVIVKFFLHISEKEQAKRFKKLAKDPAYAWKVGKAEKKRHKHYEDYLPSIEDMLRETSTPFAPWTLVPATDERFAIVKVAETLQVAIERALALRQSKEANPPTPAPPAPPRRTSPLEQADLSQSLERDEYKEKLDELQMELRRLQHLCYRERRPVAILYEGWDAAGKGGNIRRLVRELDPRGYEVVPVAAPEGEERKHHYLWRFWKALPKAGHLTIFDRTWYGRVLVERVEGFATIAEWQRAYREINEFETQLCEYGMVMIKFWIHLSKEEQLSRFEARQQTPHKQWKITEEDWRNRERWDEYWEAVSDMIERTSTPHAPWTIIEGNDKLHARVQALEVVTGRIADALDQKD